MSSDLVVNRPEKADKKTLERGVVTIRGIEDQLYNQIFLKAKKSGRNVGEIVNEAFLLYLTETSSKKRTNLGGGLGTLALNKADLESLEEVTISDVGVLTFEDDIDVDTFDKHISLIQKCGIVAAPKNIYIRLLSKVRNCGKVIEGTIAQVRGIEVLELSKEDLRSIGKKVIIREVENLKLLPDIDKATIEEYILEIKDVEHLEVPSSIYTHLLTRVRDCESITRY